MTHHATDQKYYTAIPPNSLGERLTIIARERMYDDFMRICSPTRESTVLDVGVADVEHDAANALERHYPYLDQLTAAGASTGAIFRATFPGIKYVSIEPGERLPFADKAFDVATSNAVLEHVGSRANQVMFVSEICRVARAVFIIVPNRFFPVEHHTSVPLLHYTNATFRFICGLLGKQEWTQEKNLILMSRKYLLSLFPPESHAQAGYTGLKMGALSSNLFIHVKA